MSGGSWLMVVKRIRGMRLGSSSGAWVTWAGAMRDVAGKESIIKSAHRFCNTRSRESGHTRIDKTLALHGQRAHLRLREQGGKTWWGLKLVFGNTEYVCKYYNESIDQCLLLQYKLQFRYCVIRSKTGTGNQTAENQSFYKHCRDYASIHQLRTRKEGPIKLD